MECEEREENVRGRNEATAAGRRRGVKRERAGGGVRLAGPVAVAGRALVARVPQPSRTPRAIHPSEPPFMNEMDEISYWIYTKRAPCLLSYDNEIKKQSEQAHCSKPKPPSIVSIPDDSPSPRKKKRKLIALDDDSASTERQQNVYFETSQTHNHRTVPSSCKTSVRSSDIDFNIKDKSGQEKQKQIKQKNNSLHKRSKPITSTPNAATNLRRSLRNTRKSTHDTRLNNSFEILNVSIVNDNVKDSIITLHKHENIKLEHNKPKKPSETPARKGQSVENIDVTPKPRLDAANNRHFEDLSDVSGFTASYIRSTRLNSAKTPRTIRNKANRNLIKESQQDTQKPVTTMVVSVNKSVNTGLPKDTMLNYSTDSSHNVINLISRDDNNRPTKVNRCTSLLKFIDPKINKTKDSILKNKSDSRQSNKIKLNTSFLSQSSGTSRYPKRYKNNSTELQTLIASTATLNRKLNSGKRRKASKNSSELENSERKENPEEKSMSRTRSGKSVGLTIRQPENSVLVLTNSTEHVSSVATINVASPKHDKQRKKKRTSPRLTRSAKKAVNKSEQSKRTSLREKSGLAACFSDSDDDEPLKQNKYFC